MHLLVISKHLVYTLQHDNKLKSISISISFIIRLVPFKLTFVHFSQQQTSRVKHNPSILWENTPRSFQTPFFQRHFIRPLSSLSFHLSLWVFNLVRIKWLRQLVLSLQHYYSTSPRHLRKVHKSRKYFFDNIGDIFMKPFVLILHC
jgi:hypothetical protein